MTLKAALLLVATTLVALGAPAPATGACTDCYSFVALDAEGSPVFVAARNAVAATAGDLFGDAAEEWLAALPEGGIVVRSGDDGTLGSIPELTARALAVGDGRLFVALASGILELDLDGGESRFVSALSARAMATADLDADGGAELVIALDGDSQLMLLDFEEDREFPLGGLRAVALAGGDLLGRGYDQLAMLLPTGSVRVLDLFDDDVPLCFLGAPAAPSSGGAVAPRGFSALPSGELLAPGPAGEFALLDPTSCKVAELDLSALDVTREAVFFSAAPPGDSPVGGQVPGDCNQDGSMDISDGVCLLGHLFLGNPPDLPCGNGAAVHPANTTLVDSNGDGNVDLSDAVYVLSFLFLGGPPPALGQQCVPIEACPDTCTR